MRKTKPRFVVSTAVDKNVQERLLKARREGKFTVPKILEMGIEQAEFLISKQRTK